MTHPPDRQMRDKQLWPLPMNAAKYQQQPGDNCREIFWGLYWGPLFDGDYQTNQILRVQAGNSIPFARSSCPNHEFYEVESDLR
jgi:hypothetical protein